MENQKARNDLDVKNPSCLEGR
ncbi:MAG: hypothetical protein QOH35_5411, partial [Acidobacteriaceae bacterium]|nr:hypothetical protein [Acidobacteriaceae bacterium]